MKGKALATVIPIITKEIVTNAQCWWAEILTTRPFRSALILASVFCQAG